MVPIKLPQAWQEDSETLILSYSIEFFRGGDVEGGQRYHKFADEDAR